MKLVDSMMARLNVLMNDFSDIPYECSIKNLTVYDQFKPTLTLSHRLHRNRTVRSEGRFTPGIAQEHAVRFTCTINKRNLAQKIYHTSSCRDHNAEYTFHIIYFSFQTPTKYWDPPAAGWQIQVRKTPLCQHEKHVSVLLTGRVFTIKLL